MKSLAIVATHPIQYYAPLYRALASSGKIELKVFYERFPTEEQQGQGFGRPFKWDIDLRSGYESAGETAGMNELFKGIASHRWHAILVHGWHSQLYRKVIGQAWNAHAPLMVRGDSHLHTDRKRWLQWLKTPIYRNLLSKFSVCFAVGTWSAQYYRHYGVPDHRIVLSPHCVDNTRLQLQSVQLRTERSQLRDAWGIHQDEFVFAFVGKMISLKQISDLIMALAELRESRPELKLRGLLAGDGPLRSELEKLAARLNVPTTFTSFLNQSEVAKAYVAADCLVLSSRSETWGLVVNEALACGLPCIVSDKVGCGVDLIVPGVNGLIYPQSNVPRLAERLAVVAGGELRLNCGDKRVRELLLKFSPDRAAQGILRGMEICRG